MGCTGSRHALRGGVRGGGRSPHARSLSGGVHHTVALKSSTLGSLSLDRDEEEIMKWRDDGGVGAAKTTPPLPLKPQLMRRQKQVPGSLAKTPQVREPEVINVWELMDGLDDKDEDGDADGEERREKSAPGSPEFDPDVIAAFRKALDEIPPPPDDPPGNEECIKKPDGPGGGGGGDEVGVKKREIQRFPGIVRARVSAFQQRIDAKLAKLAPPQPQPPALPPPPDSARKVVLYLTSLRGIHKTYEDCWSTKSILQSYACASTSATCRCTRGSRTSSTPRWAPPRAAGSRRCSRTAGTWAAPRRSAGCTRPASCRRRSRPARWRPRRAPAARALPWRRAPAAAACGSCPARSAPAAARCSSRKWAPSGGAPSATRTG